MSAESLAIVLAVGLPLLVALLLVFWFRRDMERRPETLLRETTAATAERVANDFGKTTARIEGRLDELTARARG